MDAAKRLPLPSLDSVTTRIKTEKEMEEHLNDMKPEINAFLFKWLPDGTSIREMEQLACAIFCEIHNRWEQAISKS